MIKRISAGVSIVAVLLLGAILFGCSDTNHLFVAPRFLVAANENLPGAARNLTVFSVDPTTGALAPVTGSPFSTAVDSPWGLVVHPNGKWVFIGSTVNSTIQGLLPSATGVASLGTSTGSVAAGLAGYYSKMAIDPQGTHLFTVHSNSVVDIFPISSAGAPGTVSTFTVSGSVALVGVATTTGFVYTADGGITPFNPKIFVAANNNGTLTAQGALTTTVPTTNAIQAITISPNQKFLVIGTHSNDIWLYNINSSTGALTPAFVGTTPSALLSGTGAATEQIAFTPDSTLMYVADAEGKLIHPFTVSTAGTITEQTPIATPAGFNFPNTIAVDLSGKFVYAGISSSYLPPDNPEIAGYTITPATGNLTAIAGTNPSPYPIAGGNPLSIGITW